MITEWIQSFHPYIIMWLVLVIVFIIYELITVGLTSIWFAAGSFAAMLVAAFDGGLLLQIIVFVVVSVVLLVVTRPFAGKFINSHTQRTNADQLVGQEIRISERVSNIDQTGMAVVHGQEWMVRAEDDLETIEKGQAARVLRISGVKLIVRRSADVDSSK